MQLLRQRFLRFASLRQFESSLVEVVTASIQLGAQAITLVTKRFQAHALVITVDMVILHVHPVPPLSAPEQFRHGGSQLERAPARRGHRELRAEIGG